jgi:hypothetical protein
MSLSASHQHTHCEDLASILNQNRLVKALKSLTHMRFNEYILQIQPSMSDFEKYNHRKLIFEFYNCVLCAWRARLSVESECISSQHSLDTDQETSCSERVIKVLEDWGKKCHSAIDILTTQTDCLSTRNQNYTVLEKMTLIHDAELSYIYCDEYCKFPICGYERPSYVEVTDKEFEDMIYEAKVHSLINFKLVGTIIFTIDILTRSWYESQVKMHEVKTVDSTWPFGFPVQSKIRLSNNLRIRTMEAIKNIPKRIHTATIDQYVARFVELAGLSNDELSLFALETSRIYQQVMNKGQSTDLPTMADPPTEIPAKELAVGACRDARIQIHSRLANQISNAVAKKRVERFVGKYQPITTWEILKRVPNLSLSTRQKIGRFADQGEQYPFPPEDIHKYMGIPIEFTPIYFQYGAMFHCEFTLDELWEIGRVMCIDEISMLQPILTLIHEIENWGSGS